jgi:hypothetical protein
MKATPSTIITKANKKKLSLHNIFGNTMLLHAFLSMISSKYKIIDKSINKI